MALDAAVQGHPKLAPRWPKVGSDLQLPWPSVEFDCLVELAAKEGVGFRLSCRLYLDEVEQSEIELWQMHSDSYAASNDRDQRWRKKTWAALPFVDGTRHVRRFEAYRISKSPAKPRRILGDGAAFFFPGALVDALTAGKMATGARWGDVTGFKDEAAWPESRLLIADSLVGPVVEDPSMLWSGGEDDYEFLIPRAWSLAMDPAVIRGALDFNLTVVPTEGYNVGTTVVSERAKQLITSGHRGVFFTPVLEADGELHRQFVAQWLSLDREFSAVPRGRLR
jgi:hypothetical protein